MTPLEIFTLSCGIVWIVTSIIRAISKGSPFDTGDNITSHYDAAKDDLLLSTLLLVYFYLLWFRGFTPQPVQHNLFDYAAAAFAVFFLGQFLFALFHFVMWIRLELRGMEYGYGVGGREAGLYRISKRLSPTESLLDKYSRGQRESMQIAFAIGRRKGLWLKTGFLVAALGATYFGYAYAPWLGWVLGVMALGPATMMWLIEMGDNLAYNLGAQFIPGAKVLEPEMPRMGPRDVYLQKAHGDARLATETETVAAAASGAQRSQVHNQEF